MQRWIHAERNTPEERSYYRATVGRIDAWWDAFLDRHQEIEDMFAGRCEAWNLAGWMQETLQAIDGRLICDCGPVGKGPGHRLVITPEYQVFLRPLVDKILERAPELDGWEFCAYRPAEDYDQSAAMVERRCGGNISDLRVAVDPGSDGLVDLIFFSPRTSNEEELVERRNEAFVTAEVLLGEQKLDQWIGVVDVIPESQAGEWEVLPLEGLAAEVDRHIESWRSQLPERPCTEWIDQETEWGCWEINHNPTGDDDEGRGDSGRSDGGGRGEQASGQDSWPIEEVDEERKHELIEPPDYARRQDMFVVISGFAKLTSAIFNGRAIYSECFTKSGELFCFLKIDGINGLQGSRFSDRGEIEDALNRTLKPEGIGCVIGGGTGHRYSYIDLALVSVPIGIEVIRRVLRAGKVPLRTWLLFFDTPLEGEWVGIHEDTPPPPLDTGENWGRGA